ncbi:MAG: hypothetical protein J6Y69_00425 [Treponema sp.]|nr:hypothetical protein [Treponema sp.]
MKKFKMIAGVLLTGLLLVCAASCKNVIDVVNIQGYIYALTDMEASGHVSSDGAPSSENYYDLDTYVMASGGLFSYEFSFAESSENVTLTIVTGEDEVQERSGTYSVNKTTMTLRFEGETIILSYDKGRDLFIGDVRLPKIINGEFVQSETVSVSACFRAVSRVSE